MSKTIFAIAFIYLFIGSICAINFQMKELSFSQTFCYKTEEANILSKYLFVKGKIATMFSYDTNTGEVYVAEHFDKNGQCVTLKDGEIDFYHSSGIYEVFQDTWIVLSDFNFCGFYYGIWNRACKLRVSNSIKVENKSGIYYLYVIKMPKSLYTQKILCYKNAELKEHPDAFAELHFYLNTPITYLMNIRYKNFFLRQITMELLNSKVSHYYIQENKYLP